MVAAVLNAPLNLTAASPPAQAKPPWGLVLLLVLAMVMSFFDRGNLGVAAPVLAPELGLSQMSLGILLSAFFWTYSVFQIGSGWLVDRVEVRSAYALAFFVWSIATLSTAAVSSFGGLLCMRLVLGIGESVGYPATSHILAATFPENRRGLANSLVDLGARLGPALGTFCGAMLVVKVGWRGLFIATGIGGLLWLVPWLIWAPRVAPQRGNGGEHKVRWKTLLTRRAVWGTVGGLCGANYAWYFLLSWLPSYLTRERGLSLSSMAVWGAMPYVAMAIASISGGVLADRWIARGAPAVPLRRGFLVCGLITTAVLFPAVLLPGIHWSLAALLVACLGFGTYASNLFALTQTLAGPEAAGRWTGLQNACGNLAGIASAVFTGWLVSKTGGFTIAFLAASAACLGGAASFWFLVREPHGYARPESATAA